MEKEYALYHGDEFIDIGTVKELSEQMNIKEKTLRFYHTPTWRKKNKDGYILLSLEDD